MACRNMVATSNISFIPGVGPILRQEHSNLGESTKKGCHWVLSDYHWKNSVSTMLNHLGWPTVAEYQIQHFTKPVYSTNIFIFSHHQPFHMSILSCTMTHYTFWFLFPELISSLYPHDWNNYLHQI